LLALHPEARRGRLPRPRLPGEEPSAAVAGDDAARVQLDAAPAAEEVRDDQLVERILERAERAVEDVRPQQHASGGEVFVEDRDFVGPVAEARRVALDAQPA